MRKPWIREKRPGYTPQAGQDTDQSSKLQTPNSASLELAPGEPVGSGRQYFTCCQPAPNKP